MKKDQTKKLCQGACIAAMYVALTWLSALFGLDKGAIQVRISEALCILPIFLPAAVPGLAIGCLLANLLNGCVALDIVCLGALATRRLRGRPWLAMVPPVLANALIVPWVLRYGYGAPDAIWLMVLTVGAGEIVSVLGIGGALYIALRRQRELLAQWAA